MYNIWIVNHTSCPSCHGPELIALLHLPLDKRHEKGGVAAEAHVGKDTEDEALLLMVVCGLIFVPGLLDVLARKVPEASLDFVLVTGSLACYPDHMSEGKGDGHLGEPSCTVPRRVEFVKLLDQLLVWPPDVERNLGKKERNENGVLLTIVSFPGITLVSARAASRSPLILPALMRSMITMAEADVPLDASISMKILALVTPPSDLSARRSSARDLRLA